MFTLTRNQSAKQKISRLKIALVSAAVIATVSFSSGCTEQIPNSFRYLQQEEAFDLSIDFNTKIDLLWVVDNSASMDVSQQKLRNGFEGFVEKYMKATWDIQLAVITTDTYMANPAFSNYINTVIPGTTGYNSAYVTGRLPTFVNPTWNPSLVNLSTGDFDIGIKYGDLIPTWGPDYAKLIEGKHDGPIPALCTELLPHFYNGVADCAVRDDQTAYNGAENCLNPGAGETSLSQCVNTVQNDTVRSGRAIVKTQPPEGTSADAAWTQALLDDAMINLTTGSAGQGSERGFQSVLQVLSDNEVTSTAFFRRGSLRVVIFVSDEDEQSMEIPEIPGAGFTPTTDYSGTCDAKTVDGHTYTLSTCPDSAKLISVSSVKTQFDNFFKTLDEADSPNYFVVSIVPITGSDIQALQADRDASDASIGVGATVAVDRADRYLDLGNLVGNGSLSLSIASSDYNPVLDQIGNAIIEKAGSFQLKRAPTGEEDMIVKVLHANGSQTILTDDRYTIIGRSVKFTSLEFILSLSSADKIFVSYQPKGAY